MKKNLSLFFICTSLMLTAVNITFETPEIYNNRFANDLPLIREIGNPRIPYVPIKILLPMGTKAENISLQFTGQNFIHTSWVDFVREPKPISLPAPDFTEPNDEVYSRDSFYPETDFEVLGTQRYNGFELLLLNVFPYKYNPVTQIVTWWTAADISFDTVYDNAIALQQNDFLVKDHNTLQNLERIALNPEEASSYIKQGTNSLRTLVDPADPYSMIIVTDSQRAGFFSDFISWKNSHGISTALFLIEDIYAEYTGANNPDKIRNFIIDAHQTYSGTDTPLQYVILGGDDEIIPIRTVFIDTGYGTMDANMPCDAYYSCLDGDWDANGNGIYGEVADNVDFIPEIAVGRITAETEEEFNRFFNKTYHYVDQTSVSDDIVYKFGENLNNNPLTWGGDYMDEVIAEVPNLQEDYHIFKLYDRDGTFSSQAVKDAINNGVAIINHMGHSNETMVFGQNNGQCAYYTNTEFGFAYSQGCYPAAFDEMTSQSTESIAENLVIAEGGLFAFVGNTRYGWYSPGSTNGPSQPYDIEFFRAIFTDNIRSLGEALSQSRVVLANQAMSNSFLRWVHYELVLFGDPSVEIKFANGSFPFLVPTEVVYEDFNTGDGDGTPNPGEEIEIFVEIENLAGWANAEQVSADITFLDDAIQVISGEVYYGSITSGTAINSDPFVVLIPQNCNYDSYNYILNINAPAGAGNFSKSFELSFEVSLFQENWPWMTSNSIPGNPIIADFDGDGTQNVLIVDAVANINLLDAQAILQNGFPWNYEENIWKSSALADIDNDENPDLVITSRTGRVFAVDNQNNEIFNTQFAADQILTPVIADFDGDGNMEVASLGLDRNLHVIKSDGSILAGFPVLMPGLTFYDLTAADLDQDGSVELIISLQNGQLYVINSQGQNFDGFPVDLGAPICSAPIVLDNRKIVLGTADHKLKIIDNLGNIIGDFNTDNKIAGSPIAADFDNDGELEIAYVSIMGLANIIKQDGSALAGWPVATASSVINPPLAADIDNDDFSELLFFSHNNKLFAYNHDGSEVEFAPVPVNMIGNAPASLEDIDGDGDFEIVSGLSTGAFAIDIKLAKGTKTPWKTYRGNYSRTGFYGDNELYTSSSDLLPNIIKAELFQNYPNPFNPITKISFAVNEPSCIDLDVYNIKGQKVRTLISDQQFENGLYQIQWNGKDDQSKSVASGVYFYRLRVNGQYLSVRKCLLLK